MAAVLKSVVEGRGDAWLVEPVFKTEERPFLKLLGHFTAVGFLKWKDDSLAKTKVLGVRYFQAFGEGSRHRYHLSYCWKQPFECLILFCVHQMVGTRERLGKTPNSKPAIYWILCV
jgi:hypothetical protein